MRRWLLAALGWLAVMATIGLADAQPLHNSDTVRGMVGWSADQVTGTLGPPRERSTLTEGRFAGELLYYMTWDGARRQIARLKVVNGRVTEVAIVNARE